MMLTMTGNTSEASEVLTWKQIQSFFLFSKQQNHNKLQFEQPEFEAYEGQEIMEHNVNEFERLGTHLLLLHQSKF